MGVSFLGLKATTVGGRWLGRAENSEGGKKTEGADLLRTGVLAAEALCFSSEEGWKRAFLNGNSLWRDRLSPRGQFSNQVRERSFSSRAQISAVCFQAGLSPSQGGTPPRSPRRPPIPSRAYLVPNNCQPCLPQNRPRHSLLFLIN